MFLDMSLTSTLCEERQKNTHGNTSLVGDISEIDAFKSQRIETRVEVVTFFFSLFPFNSVVFRSVLPVSQRYDVRTFGKYLKTSFKFKCQLLDYNNGLGVRVRAMIGLGLGSP